MDEELVTLVIQQIAEQQHVQKKTLDLKRKRIADEVLPDLIKCCRDEFLQSSTLNLQGNQLGEQAAAALGALLQDESCQVTTLMLSFNKLNSHACSALFTGIVGSGLQHLDLSNNAIGSGDAHWVPALTQALNAQNSHLTSLNLYKTQIDDEAACVIAQAIGASRLSELNIGYNRFGQSGLEAICTSCATLPTLRKLHARTL
eukprot:m.335919 g.335919  ORF g.335919 m.335919 type:complete len:202 (-) comp16077_c1_seq16:3927-4532(-)